MDFGVFFFGGGGGVEVSCLSEERRLKTLNRKQIKQNRKALRRSGKERERHSRFLPPPSFQLPTTHPCLPLRGPSAHRAVFFGGDPGRVEGDDVADGDGRGRGARQHADEQPFDRREGSGSGSSGSSGSSCCRHGPLPRRSRSGSRCCRCIEGGSHRPPAWNTTRVSLGAIIADIPAETASPRDFPASAARVETAMAST